jgi:hypothetical protein
MIDRIRDASSRLPLRLAAPNDLRRDRVAAPQALEHLLARAEQLRLAVLEQQQGVHLRQQSRCDG